MVSYRAVQLAYQAHKDQYDKQHRPYIYHVFSVAREVSMIDPLLEDVALLHDTIEDGGVEYYGLIMFDLGNRVADAVQRLTHLPSEPYKDYLERVAKDPRDRLVKLCDVKVNLADLGNIPDAATRERLTAKYLGALDFLMNY